MPGGGCRYCGDFSAAIEPVNYRMGSEAAAVWADGFRTTDASILEAKCVGPSEHSPWVAGSDVPEIVRRTARQAFEHEIERFTKVWADPATPVRGLEVVTDDPRAVRYLEEILGRHEIPSRVVVRG